MATSRGSASMALRIVFIALAAVAVAGSRFRYGSVSWEPMLSKTPSTSAQYWVKFYIRTQFRRSYLWGTAFQEEWAFGQQSTTAEDPNNVLTWYGSEFSNQADRQARGSYLTSCPAGSSDDSDLSTFKQCYSCPDGTGGSNVDSYPDFDKHWGCTPVDAYPTALPPPVDTHNFYVKFPAKMQEFNPTEPVRVCPSPFYCDSKMTLETDGNFDGYFDVFFTGDPNSVADNDLCSPDKYENDPGWTLPNSPCAPWHEVYGFYTGATLQDGITTDINNYNAEVTMKAVDYDKCFDSGRPASCDQPGHRNPAVGDYINLMGEVEVEYWYQDNTDAPYVAYFTGGDRLYGCAYAPKNPSEFPGYDVAGGCPASVSEYGLPQANGLLRNNAQGRYRLETTVHLSLGSINKSPVVMMPPLIVIQAQSQGTPARFQIPAFDPEDEAISFRLGNHREHGGSIRSALDAYPWEGIFQRLDAINQTGTGTVGAVGYDTDPSSPYRGMMMPFPRNDTDAPIMRQLGNFGCNFYDITLLESSVCSPDRLASAPAGATVSSSGMVEWHTWYKANETCDDSAEAGCSRLATGLYNFVVMVEEVIPSGTGRVKVPVDFLAYLYEDGVSFCGADCDNVPTIIGPPPSLPIQNAGLPTFADRDGMYGGEMTGSNPAGAQSCTICSYQGLTQSCIASDPLLPATACTCSLNQAPVFYQSPTKEYNNIPETPLLTEWQAWAATGATGDRPYLTYYLGEDVEFYVTVLDEDNCAELYLEATALPFGDGTLSEFSEPIYEDTYPSGAAVSYPQGMMLRKKFKWSANLATGISYQSDTRPRFSLACFTASDKYLYHSDGTGTATLQPYCVEIRLVPPPPQTEQSLFRFDWDQDGGCTSPKLGISWHPVLLRYVLIDQGERYYTACKFEQYMWHHVFATVGEDRMASLYVDGELQELMKEVGQDPLQPATFDVGINVGSSVEIVAYVNKCKVAAPPAPNWWTCNTGINYPDCPNTHQFANRRRLQGLYDAQDLEGTFSATSSHPVEDGFDYEFNSTLGYVVEEGLAPPDGSCCGFRMGMECAGESNSFDGFIDEVVVYNRRVDADDIKPIMFKMPQYLPNRELEVPRGVAQDLAAGRVLWTRFNNPCMEGPIPVGATVVAPQDGGGRRRLQQITKPAPTNYGLLSTDAPNNDGRRLGVSDKAGMSSGGAALHADGKTTLTILDDDGDRTNFIGFRLSSRYAYTGVPWLAPTISRVEVEGEVISTANPLPLDGGIDVTLSGVGFARSPWLKCVSVQPDVRAKYETDILKIAEDYEPRAETNSNVYDNFFQSMSLSEMMIESMPWMYESMDGILMRPAETLREPDEWSPYLVTTSKKHPQNKGKTAYDPQCGLPSFDPVQRCDMNDVLGWENAPTCAYCPDDGAVRLDWHPTNLRNPKTPPFEQMPSRAALSSNPATAKYEYTLYDDFIYGGWEKVSCTVAPAAFPSDHYYVGVSNDGGLTGSPATGNMASAVTFTEYALELDGSQYIELQSSVSSGRSFTMWFLPKDLTGFQMLMNITGGVGVAMQDGEVNVFSSDGQIEYPKAGEAGAVVTAGEWHHMALFLSGTSGSTLKFFLDGVEVLTDGTIVLGTSNPKLEAVGWNYVGYLDEVKIIQPAQDGAIETLMWDREKPNPNLNNLKTYLRFNAPTLQFKSGKQQGLADSSGNSVQVVCAPSPSSCSFLPVPAPWEPTSLYTVNGDGPKVYTYPMTGGGQLAVTGFNFAPSPWLQCGWGRDLQEVYSRTYDATVNVNPLGTCPYEVGELNSVLGKPSQLLPYSVYQFNEDTSAYTAATTAGFSSWSADYESTMTLDCPTPLADPDVYYMSVSGRKFLNTYPFEVTDVSLYCNGVDTYGTVPAEDSTVVISTSTQGYTFAAWIMPFGPVPEDSDAEDLRDIASDKLGFTASYNPEKKPEQTIFAMENMVGDVKHAGSLMYDGVRFFYYDDCILDAASTLEIGSRPYEWHFVAVRIDEEGEGDLFVDGIMVEHFSTTCKPEANSTFSICMDEDLNGQPSAFFHGLVDEVKVITQAMGDDDLRKYMFNQKAHAELSRNLMYFSFDTCAEDGDMTYVPPSELLDQFQVSVPVGPNMTVSGAACGGDLLAPANGPWRPARMMAQSMVDGGVSGSHKLRVVGANMAVSQWLGVTFNGTFSPAVEMEGPNVIIVETPQAADEVVLQESLSNWAGATEISNVPETLLPSVSADDTVEVSLSGSVQDLGYGLAAYYAFDAAPSNGPVELQDKLIPNADMLYDFAGENRHGAVETGLAVPDRDGYNSGAILIDSNHSVAYLPPPATYMDATSYTICVWMQMSFGPEQSMTSLSPALASLHGAWKMYTLVRYESGEFAVYLNSEPTQEEELTALFQQVADNFLETGIAFYGLPVPAAVDDMWVYDRALTSSEVRARYYTNNIALDFSKPSLDTGFGAMPASTPDMMSPDYAPGFMWPAVDPRDPSMMLGGMGMMAMPGMAASVMAAKAAPTTMPEPVAPAVITDLVVPPGAPTFTAWVYPWEAVDGPTTIFADSEAGWALGLRGERLSFYVYTGCPCEPCNQYREVVSWKARVLPGRWTHVAAKYDNLETSLDGNIITLYINGVLMDKRVFTEQGVRPIVSTGTASVGADIDGSKRFNGMIYSIGVHSNYVPWTIKREVQCPQRDPADFVLYMGASKAAAYGERSVFVMGVAPTDDSAILVGQLPASVYVNATYDDPTVAESVTFTGPDHMFKYGGYTGDYTITARTTCGKKRVYGGDSFGVSMALVSDPAYDTSSKVTVTDASDGNYHVSYSDLVCGDYETTVTLGGANVSTFATTIAPGPTSPSVSELLTQQSGACMGPFGVVHTLQIQARDGAGCDQVSGMDNVTAHISGPADMVVTAVHVGGGLYEASFVPPVFGKYFVELKLTNAEFADPVGFTSTPYLCIDICRGHSAVFDGSDAVSTTQATSDLLDTVGGSGAITMEAWVKPSTTLGGVGHVIYRGSVSEADSPATIKGYSLSLSADLQFATASVYLGLGEYLELSMLANAATEAWTHLAATYDGYVLKGYKDGVLVTETDPWTEMRPMHHNMYGHPLTVGYKFVGAIDEAAVWSRALSAEEVMGKMYCPKHLDLDDIVAYLPLNDEPGTSDLVVFGAASAASFPYAPYGAALGLPSAVNGTSDPVTLQAGSPYDETVRGAGIPGSAYSLISPGSDVIAGDFDSIVLNLQAYDDCGYHYIGQGQGDFKLELTKYALEYYTDLNPLADGVPMYPITVLEDPLPPVEARGLPGTCWADAPAPPYYRGDMYEVVGEAVSAGTYKAKVKNRDDVDLQDDIEVEVVARLGAQSDVEIMPIPSTEAGVSSAVRFSLSDGFDNTIFDDHSDEIIVSVFETDSEAVVPNLSDILFDAKTGEYMVSLLASSPVEHTISITITSVTKTTTTTFSKDRPSWRMLLTDNAQVPEDVKRFEAGSAADPASGDMYLFGGAAHDKSYLNDVWVLKGADPTAAKGNTVLSYRRVLTITSAAALVNDTVVEVVVDTAASIAAGKMNHHCNDIYVTMPGNGAYLKYYIDTFADSACGTSDTIVFVSIPAGSLTAPGSLDIEMYYGAPGHYWPNPYSDPEAVFAFYEGFEGGNMDKFAFVDPTSQAAVAGEGFEVEKFKEAYSGEYALHAKEGARAVIKAPADAPLDSFVMRAWFWDSNAHDAAHYISPNYGVSPTTSDGDYLLPQGGPLSAPSTGVGAYTLSHATKYCVSSPWQSSGLTDLRSAQWHRLEVMSTPEAGLTVSVDGRVIKTADPILYDRVVLSTGLSADGIGHLFLKDAHAYFDEISVTSLMMCAGADGSMAPCVTASVADAEYSVVKYLSGMGWEKVETGDMPAPPARYGHTTESYAGGMLMFGGERSSYAFNDVWWFNFATQSWNYMAPKSLTAPAPRFDHSSALSGDTMYVIGGRTGTGEVLSDIWKLDIPTMAWTKVAETTPVGARFGHGSAVASEATGAVYVYGGFTADPAGFSNSLFRCVENSGTGSMVCNDITDGCPELNVPSSARASGVGLTARTGHSMVPTAGGLIVFGGSDDSTLEPVGAYHFVEATCTWSLLSVSSGEVLGSTQVAVDLTRHDHAAVKLASWMAIHGGVSGGDFMDSTYVTAAP